MLEINWIDPAQLAKSISCNYNDDFIFLYSGLNQEIKNSKSIIALFPKNKLQLENLQDLKKYLKSDGNWLDCYFGFVSYEYKNKLEKFIGNKNFYLKFPEIFLVNFSLIFEFCHDKKILTAFFDDEKKLREALNYKDLNQDKFDIKIKSISSNFTNQEYILAIEKIKNMIQNGDFYQTNLTRKFFGEFDLDENFNFFNIFAEIAKINPTNYSSFFRFDNNFIISASPELFVEAKNSIAISRPIKGTVARLKNADEDKKNKLYLENSAKEKAENIMIVDLVRNDLSRVCEASSIKVNNLLKIDSYENLHHLSSEILGKIENKFDVIDVFEALFPAGSMTGAPKIKAIEMADEIENINRGIYSGAIGYFKNLNEMNFNVVIRTLLCQKNKFEFQVGGAITFDSQAKKELEEIFVKAKNIFEILGVKNYL